MQDPDGAIAVLTPAGEVFPAGKVSGGEADFKALADPVKHATGLILSMFAGRYQLPEGGAFNRRTAIHTPACCRSA
ncbi:hypothetical protein DSCA_63020 [Desulfosarcina alkanivorans]|uniref:Uncharacterized protein n=1 Tax=Desulfosarcina alkanivorans TaxID=571177 RepID=A0A5K7YRF0_9BACT|nr:hypothetical protein DSCA_63020 [Desulfosarcina alkanivorans]